MYRVSQTFETLGTPCACGFVRREAAEIFADKLRAEVAAMVADLADGAAVYGPEAGEYVADQAVQIEEV